MPDMDRPQDTAQPQTSADPNTGAETGPVIKDGDMATFMVDVIEKSMTVPVLVSFWTEWSENCKKLSPLLEKVVTQAAGAVHLVRINFEQNQQLASQMKIQSVPTVVVFTNQRPVDAFAGVKSEEEIKEFIGRYAPEMQPSPAEKVLEQAAQVFEAQDYQNAGSLFSQVLQAEPDNALAIAGLAQCLIHLGDLDNAKSILATSPKHHENHQAILAAQAALDLAHQVADFTAAGSDVASLEQSLAKDENNHQVRFDLALILWAQGQQDAAADHLLEIVGRDRSWNEDGARKQLVKFFEMVGLMDPFTIRVRKKLSSILFS